MTSLREPAAACPDRDGEDGFTLIEMVITIGLIAIVFASVAGVLTSSLKALAIQKDRTQGNEVATQGIEDLQRRTFDNLVLCAPPSGTAPDGLDDYVKGAGCVPGATNFEDPCNNLNPGQAPAAEYSCKRLATTYNVKRWISWTDDGHTNKRLAVFVSWTDSVGPHTVSQQSSLRAPTAASIVGLANPVLTNGTASNTTLINTDGTLTSTATVTLQVNSYYLVPTDKVFATFWDRATDGTQLLDSFQLTPSCTSNCTDPITWNGTITSANNLIFGYGSQFFTFNALRVKDGKTTATISSSSKFCIPSDTTCSGNSLPSVSVASAPSSVSLTASGGQTADFTLTVNTTNIDANGHVQALLPTLAGFQALDMSPQGTCTYAACTWSTVVPKSAGYSYNRATNQTVGFTASQPYTAGSSTNTGSTASKQTTVSFG